MQAALAIKLECTAEELASTIHPHPTLSETIMEASLDLLGPTIKYKRILTIYNMPSTKYFDRQHFSDLDLERSMLASIDAELIEVNPDQMLNLITDADAVINTYVKMPAHVIEKLQKCKIIVRNGIGVDTIDMLGSLRKGIIVANVPSYCIDVVATHATTLILTCHRKIFILGTVNACIWNVKLAAPS